MGLECTKEMPVIHMEPHGFETTRIPDIEDTIRDGGIIADGNPNDPGVVKYRGVFVCGNLLLYRYVSTKDRYRGNQYTKPGYVLAWTDMQGELIPPVPVFVPLKSDDPDRQPAL